MKTHTYTLIPTHPSKPTPTYSDTQSNVKLCPGPSNSVTTLPSFFSDVTGNGLTGYDYRDAVLI